MFHRIQLIFLLRVNSGFDAIIILWWAVNVSARMIDKIPINWTKKEEISIPKMISNREMMCPKHVTYLLFFFQFFFPLATTVVCCLLHYIRHHHRYNIVFLIVTYGVPMLVMVVCYTIMGKVLWGSQSIGEHTQRQIESIKAKKKVCHLLYKLIYLFTSRWSFNLF